MCTNNYDGLSVVIPIYNCEKYLKECIESIINQRYGNLEIICIDDGSTDSSAEILDYYASIDKRIVVVHKENQGAATARNSGLDLVTMPLVTFVDADDTIEPEMYDNMIKTMHAEKLDCVCCGFRRFYESGKVVNVKSRFGDKVLRGTEIKEDIIKCLIGFSKEDSSCLCPLWNKIFITDIIKRNKIRINEKRTHGEDWLFCIEYYAAIESIGFTEEIYYNYRYVQNSLVTKPRKEYFEWSVEANTLFIELFPDLDVTVFAKERNNLPINAALYYRHTYKGEERKQLLEKIFRICLETNYYEKQICMDKRHIKLQRCLDEDNPRAFVRCLKKTTNKEYYVILIKRVIKKLIRQ